MPTTEQVMDELERLSPRERRVLSKMMREKAEDGSSDTYYKLAASIYEELPVPMEEFLDGEYFLNMGNQLYPKIRDMLIEIDQPNIREFDLVLGKGSGKSAIVSVTMARQVYRVECFKNPQRFFGLMDGSPIAIINLSINSDQAQRVVFTEFLSRLHSCAWFGGRFNDKSREVFFPKSVIAVAGHSGSTSWLGYNTLVGMLDEANFFLDDGARRSVAEELLGTLKGSLLTRFRHHYKLGCISSVRTHNDFMFGRVQRTQQRGREVPWDELGKV